MVIEVTVHARREVDGSWTLEVPRLTSTSPGRATIAASGDGVSSGGIAQAMTRLVSTWFQADSRDDVDILAEGDSGGAGSRHPPIETDAGESGDQEH